ncbi:MAG TPA: 50S ribosomal protein L29 [Candidatus Thermoplasmatota archaeon]|jgi:large subunit ribosomal protein L29|nr:50S ribosomal protein L29 [Candidatus Thermoplasmatota archaeon]
MALKTKEIRGMSAPDRAKVLRENRAELMHERGLAAMGGSVKNPGRIRDLRTTIARVLTIEREMGETGRPALAAPAKPKPRPAAPSKATAKPKAAAKPAKAAPKGAPKAAAKPKAKTTAPKGGAR